MHRRAILLVLSTCALGCVAPSAPPPRPASPPTAAASVVVETPAPAASSSRTAIAQPSTACRALATEKPRTPAAADWIVLSPLAKAPSPAKLADLEPGTFVVSPDGKHGAARTVGEKRLRVFDLHTGAELPWSGRLGPVNHFELAGDRALVAVETTDGYDVALVDLGTGETLRRTSHQSLPQLAFSRQGNVYAAGAYGATVSVRSTVDDRELLRVPMPSVGIELSGDGTAFVTTTMDGKGQCSLEIHRLDGKGKRRVSMGAECPRNVAVGSRGERIAWVDVDRKDPKLPWYVMLLEKTGARRRGPSVPLTGWTGLAFDSAEDRVVLTLSGHALVGRLTDAALAARPVIDAHRVVAADDGTLVEASEEGFYRHGASASTELLARPAASAHRGGAVAGPTSVRWFTHEGTLVGGVLAATRFRQPVVIGDELGVLTDRGDLTLARAPTGVVLSGLVPMRAACTYDHGCVRLAPGLVANLDVSNAHLGDHAKVGLAGPYPPDAEPPRIEAPFVSLATGVATDGTFVQVARGKLAVRNVCAPEPWRTFPLSVPDPHDVQVCPGFVLFQTRRRDGLGVVSTADGTSLGTLAWTTGGAIPSCAAAQREIEGGAAQAGVR